MLKFGIQQKQSMIIMAKAKEVGAHDFTIKVGYIKDQGFKALETQKHTHTCTVKVTQTQKSNLHEGQHVTVVRAGWFGLGPGRYLAGYGKGSNVAPSIKGKVFEIHG